jgi:hypothetical protein
MSGARNREKLLQVAEYVSHILQLFRIDVELPEKAVDPFADGFETPQKRT